MGEPLVPKRVAILGCGFMGTALLQGWFRDSGIGQSGEGQDFVFTACVRSPASLDRLKHNLAECPTRPSELVCGAEAAGRLAREADVIIIGCAPGDLDVMWDSINARNLRHDQVIVTLLAGVSYAKFRTSLQKALRSNDDSASDHRIVRLLPSLGAKMGESVSLVAEEAGLSAKDGLVESLFLRIGTVRYIAERLMDNATALGAVCHALAIVSVDALADAGAADRLPRDVAEALIVQTNLSGNKLLSRGGMSTAEMKQAMAVPQGITINAILNLDQSVRSGISQTARQATRYTLSMGE